ncbi:mandelate racemase/muconate lactonizing enzyme family protein [Rouxiella badensis]|uniref:mandelate racemase/muconate lactonizing enzyme family protein n=1 Tax=Rouxiella badensis TaxID=1646377 RepID=UPI001B715D3C|nr:mandelate racemase/muconate lactonizing enzyme family protein [Rouxiella badensis]MCC3747553.1 mandelate racemase/muconate lactonizing enzyme family protein [Rouxiella badensis]
MLHKIIRIEATPVFVPGEVDVAGLTIAGKLSGVIVEIETAGGIIGHGFTAVTDEEVIAAIIRSVVTPNLLGMDAINREAISEKLYWLLTPRGQTGYASHAISAIDIAIWDIIGKSTTLPVWQLLGGARSEVSLYTTFGFGSLDQEQLAHAASGLVKAGHKRLKMLVGYHALERRDQGRSLDDVIHDDARRVRAVREAVGDEVEIYIDANCGLDHYHALRLAQNISDCNIAFFEEPIADNDPLKLADLRNRISIPVAAGQSEGQLFRFRDMLTRGAVDILQPNVCICGGYSAGLRAASLARSFGVPIDNGGTFPFQNMHLHAGVANGGMVEWHVVVIDICRKLFKGLPDWDNGKLTLPTAPGLGFELNKEALGEFSKGPFSLGHGKA